MAPLSPADEALKRSITAVLEELELTGAVECQLAMVCGVALGLLDRVATVAEVLTCTKCGTVYDARANCCPCITITKLEQRCAELDRKGFAFSERLKEEMAKTAAANRDAVSNLERLAAKNVQLRHMEAQIGALEKALRDMHDNIALTLEF